jgi:hypothetical protein
VAADEDRWDRSWWGKGDGGWRPLVGEDGRFAGDKRREDLEHGFGDGSAVVFWSADGPPEWGCRKAASAYP